MSDARYFDTGATRDTEDGKLDFEACLSPVVLRRYVEYMYQHNQQSDGKQRPGDNWQRGIPIPVYMKSLMRHVMAVWEDHRVLVASPHWGEFPEDMEQVQDDLCAVIFNAMGLLYEHMRSS